MYLIDGNNVMGQRVGWHRDKPAARRLLLEQLARFVKLKKVRVSVVFDGAPESGFPDGSSFQGVKVFYSKQGSDADSRIIEFVEGERNRKNMTVITSDGKLASRVRVCGVRVTRSGEFRAVLDQMPAEIVQGEDPAVKGSEIKDWMRYFGASDDDNESDEEF